MVVWSQIIWGHPEETVPGVEAHTCNLSTQTEGGAAVSSSVHGKFRPAL